MARRSVQLLLFLQKSYRIFGIHSPNQPNQISSSFNRKNVIFLLCLMQSIASTAAFLFFEAKSVLNFGVCIFFLSSWFVGLILYATLICQMGNILKFIKDCEAFIETSRCKNSRILFLFPNENLCKFNRILRNEHL